MGAFREDIIFKNKVSDLQICTPFPISHSWSIVEEVFKMQKSPIFETVLGFLEKDLSPIIFELPLWRKSKTGTVFIFTPINFNK